MAGNPAFETAEPGPDSAVSPIRLLIVDDSAVARAVLARMISQDPIFEIVDAVASAQMAIDRLALLAKLVDVILLDIEMPGRSGIAALPELIARSDGARVMVVSAVAEEGAAATVEALTLGAADTLAKPGTGTFGGRFAEVLRDRLIKLGRRDETPRAIDAEAPRVRPAPSPISLRAADKPLDCIAIGASTGGLHALARLLRALPQSLEAPILITQHLPEAFMSYFAEQMQSISGRKAVVARPGMPVLAGRIHVAPGNAHLCVENIDGKHSIYLPNHPASSGCLPSVDPMFESIATSYGDHAAGVVLSGMGRDGSEGARNMVDAGADVFAQDVETSVVWGMPGSIARAGIASAVLPPEDIARLLQRRWERA